MTLSLGSHTSLDEQSSLAWGRLPSTCTQWGQPPEPPVPELQGSGWETQREGSEIPQGPFQLLHSG